MAKKWKKILLVVFSCLFVFSRLASAAGETINSITGDRYPNQVQRTINDTVKQDKGNLPNAVGFGNLMTNTYWASTAMGILITDPTQTGTGGPANLSSLENVSQMIGMLYTPPATANEYVADLIQDAGIAPPAYAQGLGFSSLAPVLETWKIFRTVAYFFYVIIFLIIGFMIMLRQKIGSQTVVTVQQALPKLLVSLIAVTFSYAIAGLLIEVMYIAMFLILNIFVASSLGGIVIPGTGVGGPVKLQDFGSNSNIFSIAGIIINGGTLNNASQAVGTMVTGALGIDAAQSGANSLIGSISGLAAVVVFAIALLFSIFRLFFELLKTYINIIIMIVTAPIALMLGALPGSNAFSNWVKGLIFNLAVFPTVLVVIVMAFLLQTSISANGGFLPPYIGGTGTSGTIAPILGLGVLLVIPDIVEKVKKMAPAGPFDEFANKAGAALKKGYSGGQLVDGLGFTDTRKMPFGGLTGENILRKTTIAGGGVYGAATGLVNSPFGSKLAGTKIATQNTVSLLGTKLGDPQFGKKKP